MNAAIGTGSSSINSRLIQKFQTNSNLIFPNLIHPSVVKADTVTFQQGNIVCANNTFTVDINIGSFNVINLNCTCGHDTHIGDFNVLNPGVNCSGDVNIGNENLIGTNATVLQNLSIGNSNKIGAGAVITKSFDNELTLVGIPAKNIG